MKKRSSSDYKNLLLGLLPKGKAWNRDEGSILDQLLHSESEELSRIDVRTYDLRVERDTRATLELLTDHENDLGLPDECFEEGMTIQERRNMAHGKLIEIGGLNKQYYLDLVEELGWGTIDITEFKPFWSGNGVSGEACGDQNNIFYWQVSINIAPDDWIYFRADVSVAGDRLLRIAGSSIIRCILDRLKPAHTRIIYNYYLYAFDRSFSSAFDSIYSDAAYYNGAFTKAFSTAFYVYYGGGAFDFTAFDSSFDKQI